MAKLLPAIGSWVSRMTPGEKRFAHRLEEKLEDDYLCWYDVSIGDRNQHPDFIVFHPHRTIATPILFSCFQLIIGLPFCHRQYTYGN